MSFSEHDDCFVWTCDSCNKRAMFPPGDFWRSLRELQSRGWECCREEGGWLHYCAKHKRSAAQILDTPSSRLRGV
jgi:hypothetical protein